MKKYYKVVTRDNKSLGLRNNPNIMEFKLNSWKHEPKNRISFDSNDIGGIWVANGLSQAKGLKRYMNNKKNIDVRIFEVKIGNILHSNSYRVKTDKVKLIKELI